MKQNSLVARNLRLLLGLLLGILCLSFSAQAQTNLKFWNTTTAAAATRTWSLASHWTPSLIPTNGDLLVFGYADPSGGPSTYGTRQVNNNLTIPLTATNIAILFTNTDGWRVIVAGHTNKIVLGAAGIYQDASVAQTATPVGTANIGRNEFYNYFELFANSSIVNNSTNSFINIRQDASMWAVSNHFCLDNKGYTLTFDGPGAITFQTPNPGSHSGGAIKGAGGVIKNGLGLTSLNSSNAYTGTTMVNAGQLAIYTYSYGGGSYGVADNASLNVRVAAAGSTLNSSSLSLTNTTGAANTDTLVLNFSTLGNPTAPVIYATNLTLSGTVYVTVTGSGLSPGTVDLVKYQGTISGGGSLVTNSVPAGVVCYLTNNTSAGAIQLVIQSVPSLLWVGSTPSFTGIWDIGGNTNWLDTTLSAPAVFANGLGVSFTDASAFKTVTISSNVQPFSITLSNTVANPYTFTNTGTATHQIAGTTRIIKDGPGMLVLGMSNSYNGFTYIKNGTIRTTAANGVGTASVVTNNGTLDLGDSQTIGALSGSGLVTNSSGISITLTLHGGAVDGNFSGQIKESSGAIKLIIGGSKTTLSGANQYSGGTDISFTLGNSGNRWILLGGNNPLGTGPLTWYASGRLAPADSNPRTLTNALVLPVTADFGNAGAGLLTCSGPISLPGSPNQVGDVTMNFSSDVVFSGPIGSAAFSSLGFNKKGGPGTLTLRNNVCNLVNQNSFNHSDGTVIIDGASVLVTNLFSNPLDWRIASTVAADIGRLIITNGGSLTLGTIPGGTADLKIGYQTADPGSTNIADISGTVNAYSAVVGQGNCAKAILNLNSGGVLTVNNITSGSYSNTVTTLLEAAPNEVNFNGGTLRAADGASTAFMVGLTNAYIRSGGLILDNGTNAIRISQNLLNGGGSGGLIKLGAATLHLDGINTYAGTTTISNGTLAGIGVLSGPVVITAGGSFKPADVNTIGTFTVSNSLTFQAGSSIGMDVAKNLSPSNDVAIVTGALTYGGTLTPTTNLNVTSSFVAGDRFQLFPPGGSGNFAAISGSPGPGLAWSFSPATGILSVVVPSVTPPTLGVSQSGNVLTFTWTDPSFFLQAQTNSRSTGLGTNWANYPGGGTSPVNATINPANPTVFFRLSQ